MQSTEYSNKYYYLITHASKMKVGLFILFISWPGGVLLNSSTPIVCKAAKSENNLELNFKSSLFITKIKKEFNFVTTDFFYFFSKDTMFNFIRSKTS